MKSKLFLFFILSLTGLTAFCGKLEDFEDDFEDIIKKISTVEQLDSKAKYRNEFRLRLFRLQSAASDIQLVATQIGIREITIGQNVSEMISTINIDKKGYVKQIMREARSFAIGDIRRQIHYLRNLRFSVENRTFVPSKYYMEDLNVLIRFRRRWEVCQRVAYSKRVLSPYAISVYQKRYFSEIDRLARLIDQKLKQDKHKISERYQLLANVNRYISAWKINTKHLVNTRKRSKDINHSGNYRESPEIKAQIQEMKLIGEDIEKDLNYLMESGFQMYLKDKRFSQEQLEAMQQKLKRQQSEATAREKADKEAQKEAAPVAKIDMRELNRMYQTKKYQIYNSESKMNGVSQNYYNRYKALLPKKQKDEMDAELKKMIDQSYPPALARSTAVKKIHLKYSGNRHGCSAEELMTLMKITPGDVK